VVKGAAMEDEVLEEKFREMTLHLERLKEELADVHMRFEFHEIQLQRILDELTLPSGKVTQRFSTLETQIQLLSAKSIS
jgi:hypothetical protein